MLVAEGGSDSGGRARSGAGSGDGLLVCSDDDESGCDAEMGGGSDSRW